MNEEVVWNELVGTLWQYIMKEHMESMTGQTITDEEWELFVDRMQDAFAGEVSRLAHEFWSDWGVNQ